VHTFEFESKDRKGKNLYVCRKQFIGQAEKSNQEIST